MSESLRVLMVEDVEADAELNARELRRAGFEVEWRRVETRESMLDAIREFRPDLALCDYSLPGFSTIEALQVLAEGAPDVPAIVVTGSTNEETAVGCVKAGAWDYVLKERLVALGPAVTRALETARLRAHQRADDERLRKLERAVESSPAMVVITDREGRIEYINPAFTKITGYAPEETLGSTPRLLKSGAHEAPFYEGLWATILSDREWQGETINLRKDGTRYVQETLIAPVRDDEGSLTHFVAIGTDVTEQRQVRESLEITQFALDHSSDMVLWVDAEGRFTYANESALRTLGYTREELGALRVWDVSGSIRAESWRATWERTRQAGSVMLQDEAHRKDSSTFPAEVVVTHVHGTEREFQCANVRDVTERKRAEEALHRSEVEYRGLVEHATYGIYRSSPEGRFLSVNPALVALLGYPSAQELMGVNLARDVYLRPEERAVLMEKVRRTGRFDNVEVEWKRKDGQRITVLLSGWPVRNAEGNIEAFEAIAQDVTERRLLEAQLRQAQKMEAIGQLTGGIAHDFNNILTVILGNAELMAAALPPGAAVQEDLTELVGAARRGAAMIARLLQFSRRGMLSMKPTHLGTVVTGLGAVLRRLLPETVELVVTDLTDKSDTILADTGSVEQILMNLCTNARDAMPQGGRLRIECASAWLDEGYHVTHPWVVPGAYVCIAVSDSGIGMDQETMKRVFEPFFTTKPPGQGTGLGLAMVYGLMKQHTGMVHLYSEPGQGTTVKLYFPGAAEAPAAAAPPRISHPGPLPTGSGTILLAEDDAGIRRATRRALEGRGYSVLVAEDGEEALELYRANKEKIGLVITDLVMPKLGGRQLAEALRQEGARVKVLFMSGYSPGVAYHEGAFPPGSVFLHKPWVLTDLFTKVREMLGQPGERGTTGGDSA